MPGVTKVLGIKSFNFTLQNLKKINFEFNDDQKLNAIHLNNLPKSFMEEVKNFGDLKEGDISERIEDGFSADDSTKKQMEIATNIQRQKAVGERCNDLFNAIFKNLHDNSGGKHQIRYDDNRRLCNVIAGGNYENIINRCIGLYYYIYLVSNFK